MNIQDLMTKDVEVIDPGTSIRDVAVRMRDEDIGALPVGENDRLIGMVTDRDIVARGVASDRSPSECTVRDVMSEGVYYCFEDDDAHVAGDVMAEHKVRRLPVLNRDKRLVGIVALADLARGGAVESALREVSESMPDPRD
jgi:CBS domain-containing protein